MKPETFSQRLYGAAKARRGCGDGLRDFGQAVITYELVPGRASRGKILEAILDFSREAAQDRRISALSITDNAGGHPALTPVSLGKEIQALGIEAIIHFSCKDKNRNLIESLLFELDRAGLNNLLVMTGDYPRYGFQGQAKPVFDLDSVNALTMISEMARGLILPKRAPGGGVRLAPMEFFAGCVVSPFKYLDSEQVQQYLKLKRKVRAGARFIITQMGFDMRKYHEARLVTDMLGIKAPLLATILIPDFRLARILHRGTIPGCTMPERLLKTIETEASGPDGGMKARLERAAKMAAILIGMGYEGIHLSGPGLKYHEIRSVLDMAQGYFGHWRELVAEFLFPEEWQSFVLEADPGTGLNQPVPARLDPPGRGRLQPGYLVGAAIHRLLFEPGKGLYGLAKGIAKKVAGTRFESWIAALEYFFKELIYECYRCGDCFLADRAYLCPNSQCAKRLVNGPCGGSNRGWCEVWPGKKRCLYVREYERLEAPDLFGQAGGDVLAPRDWALDRSSSWINYYLKRDHHRIGPMEGSDASRTGEDKRGGEHRQREAEER